MRLEAEVARLLSRHNKTIAVAESCTGGLISHLLTNIPGSSQYFKSGVIAYSVEAKISQLKLSQKSIARYGTVSSETALSMAKSIRKIAKADIGISTTGIAGPESAIKFEDVKPAKKNVSQPVGLVYIGLAHKRGAIFRRFRFKGGREMVKLKTSRAALKMVKEWIIQSGHLLP